MPEPINRAATLAGGAALAFLLSACGGGDTGRAEREPDTVAGGAEGAEETAAAEEAVELVDPMELAPDHLCEVLSQDTLDEFVGPGRAGNQEGEGGVPDPDSLENTGQLTMTCITTDVDIDAGAPRSHSLTYRLEISEELQMDDYVLPIEESEADPSLGVGELAAIEFQREGTSAELTVVDGQVLVKVTYDADEVVDDGAGDYVGVAYLDEEEMTRRAVTVAEEILAAVG
ncbi:hypothetical protein [Nocardiopsis lucentensis]|uniref:hypothetical protein n=1 Tax=Nocardiopsis lucentensis TaxID=53441 RepID=UPI000346643C|nr:hypothetical protein [Nocardiopsis lucentensis]